MSSLCLGIETSTTAFVVALTEGPTLLSSQSFDVRDALSLDLGSIVLKTLGEAGRIITEVGLIVVDRGPGSLSSVRSGVAFANALAASARVPLVQVSSFELMYRSSSKHRDMPWVCFRKGSGEYLYAGVVTGTGLSRQAYGLPQSIADQLQIDGDVVVAGVAQNFLQHLSHVRVLDSGIGHPGVDGLVGFMCDPSLATRERVDLVVPITERVEVLDERT